jgi:hypothetical protein
MQEQSAKPDGLKWRLLLVVPPTRSLNPAPSAASFQQIVSVCLNSECQLKQKIHRFFAHEATTTKSSLVAYDWLKLMILPRAWEP